MGRLLGNGFWWCKSFHRKERTRGGAVAERAGQERRGRDTAKGPPWRPSAPDDAWGSLNRSIGIRAACNQQENKKI